MESKSERSIMFPSSVTPSTKRRSSFNKKKESGNSLTHRPTYISNDWGNWQTTLEDKESEHDQEKEKHLIVESIRQEIIDTAMEKIYVNYLEKQTVHFVSHCSRRAWEALIEWNYQVKDKGGLLNSDRECLDSEPERSQKDSWAAHSVLVGVDSQVVSARQDMKDTLTTEPYESEDESKSKIAEEVTLHIEHLKKKFSRQKFHYVTRGIESKGRKSDEIHKNVPGNNKVLVESRKESYELPSPSPLHPKHFPSSRVEVKYAITAGIRALVSKKEHSTKTIILQKEKQIDQTDETASTKH